MTEAPDDAIARARRILAVVRAIPPGRVRSYGEVAALAGLPGRARLVARVLAQTDEPDLPWHRVVGSGGRLALDAGCESGLRQRRRLAAEGLELRGNRVTPMQIDAGDDLDAAVWGPDRGSR